MTALIETNWQHEEIVVKKKIGLMCLIFLPCHLLVITWQEATSLFPMHAAHLTPFRKPSLPLMMAEDGVKGHRVGVQAKMALVLVCRRLFRGSRLVCWRFVTRHLLWCHQGHPCRTLASWVPSPSLITSQLSSPWLFKNPAGGEILIELHGYMISKDIGK